MTRYYYRGWVGRVPVDGFIDLPDDVKWAKEAATEHIMERVRRETPFPLSCLQQAHIAYVRDAEMKEEAQ